MLLRSISLLLMALRHPLFVPSEGWYILCCRPPEHSIYVNPCKMRNHWPPTVLNRSGSRVSVLTVAVTVLVLGLLINKSFLLARFSNSTATERKPLQCCCIGWPCADAIRRGRKRRVEDFKDLPFKLLLLLLLWLWREVGAAELMGLLLSTNVDGICCPQCGGGRINSMIRNGRPQWAVSHVRREAEAFE